MKGGKAFQQASITTLFSTVVKEKAAAVVVTNPYTVEDTGLTVDEVAAQIEEEEGCEV